LSKLIGKYSNWPIFAKNIFKMTVTRLKRKDRRNKTTSVLRKARIKKNSMLNTVKSPNKEKTVIIEE